MTLPVPEALRTAWDCSPALVIVTEGPEHVLTYQNDASAALFGRRPTGVAMSDAFPELRGRTMETLDAVRETGRVVQVPRADTGVRDVEGGVVHLRYVLAPLGAGPPYDGVVVTSVDVTAEAHAEQAVVRAELLSRVAERMNSAADPDAALAALADQLVPEIADLAAVYVVHGLPDRGRDAALAEQREPAAMTVSPRLLSAAGRPPPPGPREGPSPWDALLAAGKTIVIDLEESPQLGDPVTARWLTDASARDLVVVPLAVAGVLTGALVLLGTAHRERYAEQDIAFIEHVAARAGTAVANARAHQVQRQVAINLQRALLPDAPPRLQGLKVAARYRAGGDDVEVGGDWWDVHDLGAGRVGVGVGDVSGRGVPAAIVMGQARSGMRAAAHADLPPADLLTVLDAQVNELVSVESAADSALQPRFATAAYAVIEAFDQTLRIANAGHPPLLVRDPGGAVRRVAAPPGPPLGLGIGGYEEAVIDFPAGSLLLAFTDGLVESNRVDIDSGIERLSVDLADVDADADLDVAADRLLTRGSGADDIALVLLRSDAAGLPVERYTATLEQMSDVSRTRRDLAGLAARHTPALTYRVAHVSAELLANAMSHVGPPVSVRAHVAFDRIVVEVADRSASAPRARVAADDDEHGRGLPIVSALAVAWGSRITRNGKATWAELGPRGS